MMDRWIDTYSIDQYYRSILLVTLTINSIDPSVKGFFSFIDSIDHQSRIPDQNDDDDHRSIGQKSVPLPIF
jgi:hypothetical protein